MFPSPQGLCRHLVSFLNEEFYLLFEHFFPPIANFISLTIADDAKWRNKELTLAKSMLNLLPRKIARIANNVVVSSSVQSKYV